MLSDLKPTEADIEILARTETDPAAHQRFAPLRWGFIGNLCVIVIAGGLGLIHAALAATYRRVFTPPRNDSG